MSKQSYTAEVTAVTRQSPSLVRVELGGAGLADFRSLGVPDEACVFEFPTPDTPRRHLPEPGRWYSLAEVGPQRMALGIVLHPGGRGSGWAERATVGETLRITEHNSWFKRPDDAAWQILLGDITALPAFARICAESALPTQVVLEVPDPGDEVPIAGGAGAVDVRWVHNADLAASSTLGDLVRELPRPEGPGYVYVAGESKATRTARKFLRDEWRLGNDRFGAIGYWRHAR
ncbi:siderophore-interacting protein [Sporichthya polymorpha]|uniref:siderophore-interacting protein n=1 Tax=Sporichthya polymorpha TaxID=35751 RepID=UPI00036BD786|nr:siderophore-interacting protein [Sporichthya polymorpha]